MIFAMILGQKHTPQSHGHIQCHLLYDNRGLIVHVIPERFYRGSSSYFTTTFGEVTS